MPKSISGLDVLRRRPDGYHEVKMIMQTVDLYDDLEFTKLAEDEIRIFADKEELPADQGNLIWRAAARMKELYQISEGVSVKLTSGFRCGWHGRRQRRCSGDHSCDGCVVLSRTFPGRKTENRRKARRGYPVLLMGGTALSEGIGEILTKLPDVPKAKLVIAKPDLDVSTKFVYENLHADSLQYHPDIDGMVASIEKGDLCGITDRMGNVLETVTCKHYPVIEQMKGILKEHGAVNALMSGSGPTVFGIFTDDQNAKEAYEAMREAGLARQLFLTGFADGRGRED